MSKKKAIENNNTFIQDQFEASNKKSKELKAIIDDKGKFLFISQNSKEIIGYNEDEIIEKKIFDFIRPENVESFKNEFDKLINNNEVECLPYQFKTKNNNWIWFNSVILNHSNTTSTKSYLLLCSDVTNLLKDQEELKKNSQRFDLFNKITKKILYEGDFVNNTFQFSDNFYNYFSDDFKKSGFISEDWEKLIHPLDYKRLKQNWDFFIANKNEINWANEYRMQKKDGSYLYVEDEAYIIRNKEGFPQKVFGILRNNSENKILEIKKSIENKIASFFKDEISLVKISNSILQYLIKEGDFLTAEIWILNNTKSKINLIQSVTKNKKTQSIYTKTNAIKSFKKGDGLPGDIWLKKEPLIWDKKDIEQKFKRIELASSLEINSILGIPLLHNDIFIGALVLISNDDIKKDYIRTAPFVSLGNFLGAEIRRKEQEEMLHHMFQSSSDILAIVNNKGYFLKVNPAFCKLLNYTEEELMAKPYTYFLHPDDLKKTNKEYKETITGERNSMNFVNRYRTKDGNYKWISWSSSDVFGEEGLVFAYGRNINEIKELQQLFHETAKLANVGSWVYALENNEEIYLSNITKKIFEIKSKNKVTFQDFLNFFSNENKTNIKKHFQKLIEKNKHFDQEFLIKTSKNKEKWIRCIGQHTLNSEGKCIKISGSIQDINNQKKNELELAKKNNYLSALTTIITELLHSNNWYESLNNVFKITGETIIVDRVYYFEVHENPKTSILSCSQRIEWTQENIKPEIENPILQNIPLEVFSEFFTELSKGKVFEAIVSNLPEGNLKETLQIQDIKSLIITPIIINNFLHGFIGFDDCKKERIWKNSEKSFLQNVTSNLAAKIHRMKVQSDLVKTLEERNNILESIGDAFFILDKNWIVTYWNKESEEITGVKREELIGKNFWEFFPHLKGGIYEVNYKKSVKQNKNIYFEYLDLWLDVSAYPSKEGLSVYYKDITKTKKYEKEISASNERFEKATLATNDAIWDWNLVEKSLYRGDGFKRLFGYTYPNKVYDIDIHNLFKNETHEADAKKVINSLKRVINSPEKSYWEKEYRFLKVNGKYSFVKNRVIIIRDEAGIATRIVGAIQDITERIESEESLKILNKKLEIQAKNLINSNQELEQFAFIASHDLQEPLRMVTSFLTQLENKYQNTLDEKGKKYIHFAVDGANRMRNIILDILEFSKVGKNSSEEKELINVNEIVNEVCEINKKIIEETNAQIIFGELPEILSYKSPLIQIFHNLIGNAIKYQELNSTPVINITCEKTDKMWLFKITDNGIGIPNEYIEKIFIIFQRLHSKEAYGGTGMGLAIVKKLIENLGGKIWVESEINSGSAFYFTLPIK